MNYRHFAIVAESLMLTAKRLGRLAPDATPDELATEDGCREYILQLFLAADEHGDPGGDKQTTPFFGNGRPPTDWPSTARPGRNG